MKIHSRQSNAGIALIVVMIAVAVLSILAAALALMMKTELRLAQNADSEEQIYWLGRSGVELARWVLAQEASIPNQPYDSLNQLWAGGSGTLDETNSPLNGVSLDNYQIGAGTVSLKIIDLERKVNINSADPVLLRQVFTVMGVDANNVSTLVDSIQDWIDPDDLPHTAGAESDYYQSQSPAYFAKNAPLDDLTELLLIRGVTPDMYWGTAAGQHAGSAPQKLGFGTAPGEEPQYAFGLVDVFTPFSSGRININTADANVLQMIPGVDENVAQDIIKARSGPDGVDGTDDDTPFRSPADLGKIDPQLAQQAARFCDVRSHTFEVHVTAHFENAQREFVAILLRNSNQDVRVVGFRWN